MELFSSIDAQDRMKNGLQLRWNNLHLHGMLHEI